MAATGFVTYRALEALLEASPATIRRDLTRLEEEGLIVRVHGGAKAPQDQKEERESGLSGTPFAQSILQNLPAKQAIGRAAAALCLPAKAS
ncbi:DeoR family transcriptional regulator [Novosphingobium resinovorum]